MSSLPTASKPSGWYGIVVGLAALGWNVFNAILERRPKLLVRQIGDSITDRAHTRPDGRVIYMLRAVLVNESMKKPVVIAAYHLGLPRKDEYLDLLPDPMEIEKEDYIVPGSQNSIWRYPREMILNHRVNAQGRLAPGEAMEGALLFNGMEPIPDDLPHGYEIQVDLRVLLQTGTPISTKCRMIVDKGHRTREFIEPTGAELLTKRGEYA